MNIHMDIAVVIAVFISTIVIFIVHVRSIGL
jgi:hypothetical protein